MHEPHHMYGPIPNSKLLFLYSELRILKASCTNFHMWGTLQNLAANVLLIGCCSSCSSWVCPIRTWSAWSSVTRLSSTGATASTPPCGPRPSCYRYDESQWAADVRRPSRTKFWWAAVCRVQVGRTYWAADIRCPSRTVLSGLWTPAVQSG
jgi:hypothetical protein